MVVNQLDATFAALSDPTRRAIVKRLSRGPVSVHGLSEPFTLSQQMVSKHIAVLVRAKVITKKKQGRESVCTLRPQSIKAVNEWAFNYRQFWEQSLTRLDGVVNQLQKEEIEHDRKQRINR